MKRSIQRVCLFCSIPLILPLGLIAAAFSLVTGLVAFGLGGILKVLENEVYRPVFSDSSRTYTVEPTILGKIIEASQLDHVCDGGSRVILFVFMVSTGIVGASLTTIVYALSGREWPADGLLSSV